MIIGLLISINFVVNAQAFVVTSGKKTLAKGNIETGEVAKLPSLQMLPNNVAISFKKLTSTGGAANISIMAITENRQEIGERVTVNNFKSGTINVPLIAKLKEAKGVVNLYILKINTNPDVASRERVAPILICTFK